jgi:hypothetical protein
LAKAEFGRIRIFENAMVEMSTLSRLGSYRENRLLILDGLHAKMEKTVLERNRSCEICKNGETAT